MAKNTTEELVKKLRESEGSVFRLRAAIALAETNEEEKAIAIEGLVAALKEDQSNKVREEAAKTLGLIGHGNKVVPKLLVTTMMEDESETVRQAATEALGEIGEVAIPAIQAVLKSEQNADVKEMAIITLGKIGKKVIKDEPEITKAIVPMIVNAMREMNDLEKIHRAATDAMLVLGEAGLIPLLQEHRDETDMGVRNQLNITLEKLALKLGYRNRMALIRNNDF